ncbi:MAG: Ig-like domain repeat protein, partial [Solirubrobacterales bacterium]
IGFVVAVMAMALLVVLPANNASAASVTNPGPTDLTINSGFNKLGTVIEQSIGELAEEPVIHGDVAANGDFLAPANGFVFGQLVFELEDVAVVGDVTFGIDIVPTTPITGNIDPITGQMDLLINIRIKATKLAGSSLADVGSNCYVGTIANPIVLTMSTSTGATVTDTPGLSLGGIPYDPGTGTARVANKDFAAPAQTGCSGLAASMIDDQLGLPSPSGANAGEFGLTVSPAPISTATITIDTKPSLLTNQTNANFAFSSNVASGLDYDCKLDGGAWTPCNSKTASYTGLSDGSHTFDVRALASGNPAGTQTYTWTIDTVLPIFTVNGAPLGLTNQKNANISFSSNKPVSPVSCQLDAEPVITPCSSPRALTNLSDGPHSFRVFGTDDVGNEGTTTKNWTVDATKPTVTIDSGPPPVSPTQQVTFNFTKADNQTPNPAATCRVTQNPDTTPVVVQNWTACSSPDIQIRANGFWKFEVRVTDNAGNVSDIAAYQWETNSNEPSIDQLDGPAGGFQNNSGGTTTHGGTFQFTSDTPLSTFECWLDEVSLGACTSPIDFDVNDHPELVSGEHKFEVKPTGPSLVAGQRTPYVWSIDNDDPTLTVDIAPAASSNISQAVFEFSADGTGSPVRVECKLDTAAWAPCDSVSSHEVTVADGPHVMRMKAIDGAGLQSPVRTANWITDTVSPTALITSAPLSNDKNSSAPFTFNVNDDRSGETASCKLDSGSSVACASLGNQSYSGLADGLHTFTLTVRDAAGNTVVRTHNWRSDTTAPALNISEGPANPTDALTASFKFTQSDTGSGVQSVTCQIDGGSRTPCSVDSSGYKHYPGPFLAGNHRFEVQVTDVAGNVTTSGYDWYRVPSQTDVAISTQLVQTKDTSSSIEFVSNNENANFECKLDAGAWGACTSPASYTDLSEGDHVFSVRAINQAGQRGLEKSKGWKIISDEPIVEPCPDGTTGTPPNCVTDPVTDPCPDGTTGTPPNCVEIPASECEDGQIGTPPDCKTPLSPIKKPTNAAGTFDGKKLSIRLKCGSRFKPTCNSMKAIAMTDMSKKGKKMSSAVKTKIKAGKWKLVTLKIKSQYRDDVEAMTAINQKTLTVRVDVKYKKKGKKASKRVFPTYKVRAKG